MIHYHSDLRWPVFTPLIIIKIDCRTQGHKINVYRCPIDVMRCSRKVTLWRSFYKMYPIFTHLSTLNLIKHLHSIRSSKRKYTQVEHRVLQWKEKTNRIGTTVKHVCNVCNVAMCVPDNSFGFVINTTAYHLSRYSPHLPLLKSFVGRIGKGRYSIKKALNFSMKPSSLESDECAEKKNQN